jgi:hypothetical protein
LFRKLSNNKFILNQLLLRLSNNQLSNRLSNKSNRYLNLKDPSKPPSNRVPPN